MSYLSQQSIVRQMRQAVKRTCLKAKHYKLLVFQAVMLTETHVTPETRKNNDS